MPRPRSPCATTSPAVCEMQPLESRVMLAAAPTPSDLLTRGVRQQLLNHWAGPHKAVLRAKLNAGKMGAFDARLLDYMKTRDGNPFFWKQSEIAPIVSFINTNLATAPTIEDADDVVDHRFGEQGNSGDFRIKLPDGDINWGKQPSSTTNPEFLQGLNRHEYWLDLAQSYRFTGNTKYVNEMMAQLASWSRQNPALADPNTWRETGPRWNLLNSAVRAQSWVWSYQTVLGSDGWTPAANTLFLSKLFEHGDFMRRVESYPLSSNRTLVHAHGLLQIAQLMPEFAGASEWEKYSRKLLFGAMDHQFHPDGGHVEQSPTYAINSLNDLLEAYWLDQVRGDKSAWPARRVRLLRNAMETHLQLLSPNGSLAALSDTYRSTAAHMFTKARIILDNFSWPAANPRIRDVWLFGTGRTEPLLVFPVTPALGDRGKSYGLPDAGYYVMRSALGDADARQITFDAGPTGGIHGHFDLLNFELFGYGRTLISDPGLYKYDNSPNRQYVISTRAHNTITVDGASHRALEGANNSGIMVDQWSNDIDHAQVGAHHFGYDHLAGSPVVGRSIWYDYDGTALILDWGQSSARHQYQISFNLPGDEKDVSGVQADGSFHTKYNFGNVRVAPLLRSGQTSARGPLRFVSNQAPPNGTAHAYRFTVTGSGKFQVFATLVTAYGGQSAPNITAEWVTKTPEAGQPIVLRLIKDGVAREITFAAPVRRPPANLSSTTGAANDMAYDASGRLHMVYFDRLTRNLKYSVRDAEGSWSLVQTIDPDLDAGLYVSLALDSTGAPGVAYFDGNKGDLKYARLRDGAWDVHSVDTKGSVGLYPSMVFSRSNDPIISYYHRTSGDLRLATPAKKEWAIVPIDTAGDVGRFSSVQLDPNRPNESKVAIAYEDTSDGSYKFAIQGKTSGFRYQTIDSSTTMGGGYTSLQFTPVKASDGTFRPAASYYDAGNSALKFAAFDGSKWKSQTVAADGRVGLYTSLVYDDAARPSIFFFNKSNNRGYRATLNKSKWSFALLGDGGREMSVARRANGTLAYSTLDDSEPLLEVGFLRA